MSTLEIVLLSICIVSIVWALVERNSHKEALRQLGRSRTSFLAVSRKAEEVAKEWIFSVVPREKVIDIPADIPVEIQILNFVSGHKPKSITAFGLSPEEKELVARVNHILGKTVLYEVDDPKSD